MANNLKVTPLVVCEKHGARIVKGLHERFVKVPTPTTKKQRLHGGCPFCKQEINK